MKKFSKRRIRIVMFAILLLFLTMGGRLVTLQVVEAKKFESIAARQRLRMVEIPGDRGLILDRNRTPLATNSSLKTVIANPKLIKNKLALAKKIAAILKRPLAEVMKELTKDRGFVYIARKVEASSAGKLEALKPEGLFFVDESKRVYPCGTLASNLIGFAGIDNQGLAGLEKMYETYLKGSSGILMVERDPMGREIPEGLRVVKSPKIDGKNIVLTIDGPIQSVAESVLAKTVKDFLAKGGCIIAMDPKNGAILAMANSPNFDPNHLEKVKPSMMRNQAVSDMFEPGSTFKTITATGVIEEGLASPNDYFYLEPTLKVGDRVIHEAHGRGAVSYTLTEILAKSSNIGAVKLGKMLGKERLSRYIYKFGFGSKTNIDFPGEARGMVRPPDQWYRSTMGNVPMGQGISVTAIQMLRAYAAVANNGTLVTPHILERIEESNGSPTRVFRDNQSKKILSTVTCRKIRDMLKVTVTKGTGQVARLDGYIVCGKTGTAQKPNMGGSGYSSGRYIASFIGMAPADDPKVVIVVMVDEPCPIWGGVVAAPAFKEVAQFVMQRSEVKPALEPDELVTERTGKMEVKDQ